MARILLVEDEENLRKTLRINLEMDAYEVITASNGKDALALLPTTTFDLIVLDVMLPGADGFQVCQTIRRTDRQTPILFLTARNHSQDRVRGLKLGGDDYLSKPFDLEELLLRVKNLLRRSQRPAHDAALLYRIGPHTVNFKTYEASDAQGTLRTLTQREVLLLQLLINRKNEVVSREDILESIWGHDVYPSTRTIDNYIVNFRKYFEEDPREPRYFHSVRGVGYKFTDHAT